MEIKLLLKMSISYMPALALAIGLGISGLALADNVLLSNPNTPCDKVKTLDRPWQSNVGGLQKPIISQKVMILTYADIASLELPAQNKAASK